MEEESRLREEMTNELAEIKKSHSKELEELHRKMEEEVKNNQLKGSENESRISQMQQELARKEKEIADLQVDDLQRFHHFFSSNFCLVLYSVSTESIHYRLRNLLPSNSIVSRTIKLC